MKHNGGRPWVWALLGVAVTLVLASVRLGPATVLAHANVARADPAPDSVMVRPPERVIIWFTEPVEPGFSAIQVLDSLGQRVDQGDSTVDRQDPTAMSVRLRALGNGTYTVAWRNVSAVDGHTLRGSFVFSVGEPTSGAPVAAPGVQPLFQSPLEPVLRWLVLLAALSLVGGVTFALLVSRPALARLRQQAGNGALLVEKMGRLTQGLSWGGLVLLVLASLAQLVLQTSEVRGIPLWRSVGSHLVTVVMETGWGHLWLWRVGLAVAVGLALAVERRGDRGRKRYWPSLPTTGAQGLAFVLGAGMLLTISLTSHAAATREITRMAVLSDYFHLLAAAFWVGGLFHFAPAALLVLRTLSAGEGRQLLAALVSRFSALASLSVGTLVVTGVYSAWAQVTVLPALFTPYGLTLLAKLALVAMILVLGAANLLWVRPRLARHERAGRWLRRLVTAEALLAGLVLLSVGLLASLEPARQVASSAGTGSARTLRFQDASEGATIALAIEPGVVGLNRVLVSLADQTGSPIANATEIALTFTNLDTDLGEASYVAAPVAGGRYVVEEVRLSVAGAWQLAVVVRRPESFDARTAFRFGIVPSQGSSAGITPALGTGRILWVGELLVLGALFLGTGVAIGGSRTGHGLAVMIIGAGSVVAGLVAAVNVELATPGGAGASKGNPFPPTPGSLQTGRQVYQQHCASCHGAGGHGDGPLAPGLNPRPFDLTLHAPLHPDIVLAGFISDGVPGTAMAPWRGRLTDEEVWHVINYLRSLKE
ncbi:MAG: c-type cytochrome [SAR202 cluster bacterium]|nr:c-type cytochrome [SAR202 cluster bacterium]